jgi:acetolactate synthase-1/2/3 large subunit
MNQRTTASILLDEMVQHGIDTLYCLPGVQNDDFFDTLYDYRDRIRPVHVRHEQAAGYMALGAAMATGRPQAFCVVPGPGLLNACSALATAWSTNSPVFALIGQISSRAIGQGFGLLHELPDQLAILRALTRFSARIERAEDACATARSAFKAMLTGRPRPVAVEVPLDIWKKTASVPLSSAPVEVERPPLDMDAVDRAAALIAAAKHPIIFAGSGAFYASAELRRFAERAQAAVAVNRNGHGVIDDRHDLAITAPVAHRMWKDCDLAIGIGTRMQPALQLWGRDAGLKVVRVDLDVEEMNRFGAPDVAIHADVRDALPALLNALQERPAAPDRSNAVVAIKRDVVREIGTALAPQAQWLEAIRAALPDDGIYVDDLTQVGYVSRLIYRAHMPRTYIASGYQGTLGWSYAAALGVKVARPEQAVVSISGDGGFLFTANELATAKRHGIGVIAVVFNDNAYGNVRRYQIENYDNRTIASDLASPDFVRMAQSFGISATRVATPETLQAELRRAIAADVPAVIEVPVGDFPSPWKYVQLPKVRGT